MGRNETIFTRTYGTNATKLKNHWQAYGIKEGRVESGEFNVKTYQKNYADLKKAFGNNYIKYYTHYIGVGLKENRKAI